MAKRQRLMRRALDEAELQFGAERGALTMMLDELKSQAKGQTKQALAGAQMSSEAARRALPSMRKIYDRSQREQGAVKTLLDADLAKLGQGADSYKLAAQIGSGGSRSRTAESRGRALEELVSRRTGAIESGRQEVNAIGSRFRDDASKVLQSLGMNEEKAGLFARTRYSDLRDESREFGLKRQDLKLKKKKARTDERLAEEKLAADKQLAQDKLDLDRSKLTGVDPATGKPYPKKPGEKKDKKSDLLSPKDHSKARDRIGQAGAYIPDVITHVTSQDPKAAQIWERASKAQKRQILSTWLKKGIEGDSLLGTKKVPAFEPDYASAALDLYFDKGLNADTVDRLRKRRLRVRNLGLRVNGGRSQPRPAPSWAGKVVPKRER